MAYPAQTIDGLTVRIVGADSNGYLKDEDGNVYRRAMMPLRLELVTPAAVPEVAVDPEPDVDLADPEPEDDDVDLDEDEDEDDDDDDDDEES